MRNCVRINPLGKIPALLLDDGSVIYDSPVICEYLDELGGGKFLPRATLFKAAEGRWRALTLQALGDGLADAVVRRTQELRLPEDRRSAEVIQRQTTAIEAALGVADRAAPEIPRSPHHRRNRDCLRHRLSRSAQPRRRLA